MEKREDAFETQQKQQIFDLWMRCETQDRIEEITGIKQRTVSNIIAEFSKNGQVSEFAKFRDFEQDGSALRIYDLWLRCETHEKIAEITGYDRTTITKIIQSLTENVKNAQLSDSHIFRDFGQENSALRIYDLWLRCETHEKIAEITGYDRTTITKIIQNQKRKEGK